MKIRIFVAVFGLLTLLGGSSFGQSPCPSGDTVTELSAFLKAGPCSLGSGIVLFAPLTLQSSSMPVTKTHPNITTDDITIQFGNTGSNPSTITMVAQCARCAVTGMEATQIEVGAYFTGTFTNFGALMTNWSPPAAAFNRNYCMPFTELDAELGAGNGTGVEVVRTAATYQHNEPSSYTPGSITFTTPQPITFNLMQASFGCQYTISYAATVYLSQSAPPATKN